MSSFEISVERLEELLGYKFRGFQPLASGPRSQTFLASSLEDRLAVAVKVFRYGTDAVEEKRVGKMMNLLGDCLRLDHPNVVRVLGCGCNREERLAFLIMEHVDGTNLRSYVEELGDNLTVGGALQLITQVAEGLDEIHASNLIHRDIKPDNIFVSRQTGIAKIGDFGLSVTLLDFADRLDVGRDAYGTPAFVAPEQIIGTAFDRRVDIYSFAMTVYYILTGVVAYDYRTERELLYAHIHQDPVMPSRRNSSWPEALDAALARSLSKHPERRHLNALTLAREVQRALEAFTPLRLSSFRHGTLAPQSSTEVSIKGVRI